MWIVLNVASWCSFPSLSPLAPSSAQYASSRPCLVLAATLNIRGNSYRMREHQNLLRSAADKSAGPVAG